MQKIYSQLEKEGLAVIFGVKKFHTCVYGRPFTIVTDHKPLIAPFNPLRDVPQMASPCIQRWQCFGGYEYCASSGPRASMLMGEPSGGRQSAAAAGGKSRVSDKSRAAEEMD